MPVEITKTRVDLKERAATELGALVSGQPLSAEDDATLENLVDPLVLQLSLDGVVSIQDTDEIPSEMFLPVAMLLANMAAPSFGQVFSPDVKAEQERILRRLTSKKPTFAPLQGDYF